MATPYIDLMQSEDGMTSSDCSNKYQNFYVGLPWKQNGHPQYALAVISFHLGTLDLLIYQVMFYNNSYKK